MLSNIIFAVYASSTSSIFLRLREVGRASVRLRIVSGQPLLCCTDEFTAVVRGKRGTGDDEEMGVVRIYNTV